MIRAISIMLVTGVILFVGCEDPIPTDYVPESVFTGYLIVDEPIQAIRLTRSSPPLDSFEYRNTAIIDAQIRIWSQSDTFNLQYISSDTGVGEYRAFDTTKLVKPGVEYFMEAKLADGRTLTSSTITPERVAWVQAPREVLQYPVDTIKLPSPDSLKLIWTRSPGVTEYLISVESLDTLNYGSYLEPMSEEKNRRIERFFENESDTDVIRWGFLQNTQVNVVWFAFKWFGQHEITI